MDETLRGNIKRKLSERDTSDLAQIWQEQNTDEWEPETFGIIKEILIDRLGSVPELSADKMLPLLFDELDELLENKEYARGLEVCEQAVKLAPENSRALNYRGLFLDYLGKKEEALADYKNAVRVDPDFEDARDNLYSLQEELNGRNRVKIPAYTPVTDGDLSIEAQIRNNFKLMDTESLMDIWRAHDTDEWTRLAFDILRLELQERLGDIPELAANPDLHNLIASIEEARKSNLPGSALLKCEKAEEQGPENPKVHYLHGLVLMDLNRLEEAFAEFSTVLRLAPDYPDARAMLNKARKGIESVTETISPIKHLELALEYAVDEEYDLAILEIEKSQSNLPGTAPAFTALGEAWLAVNKPDEALEAFQTAVKIDPEYSRGRTGMRNAQVMIKEMPPRADEDIDPAEIVEVDNQAVQFNPDDFEKNQDELEDTPAWVYLEQQDMSVRGSAGHRVRSGRSGLDPLDTQMELSRFEGGLIRRLFTGHLRTHDPLYLTGMVVLDILFLFPLILIAGSGNFPGNVVSDIVVLCPCGMSIIIGVALSYNLLMSALCDIPDDQDPTEKFF